MQFRARAAWLAPLPRERTNESSLLPAPVRSRITPTKAADEFPKARLAMAQALIQLGHRQDAALHLERYLSSPGDDKDRQAVETWLAGLGR